MIHYFSLHHNHIDTSNKYFGHVRCSKWLFSLKKSHLWSANKIHPKSIRGVAFSTATSFCSKLSCCRVTAIIRFFQVCYVTDTSPLGQPWWNFHSMQCSWTVESDRKGSCETPTAIQKCICIHNGTVAIDIKHLNQHEVDISRLLLMDQLNNGIFVEK